MFYSPSTSLVDWFEMKRLRTKSLDSDVWIPLWSIEEELKGAHFQPGSEQNDYCARSILVPNEFFDVVGKLQWDDVCSHYEACSWVDDDGIYISCDEARESARKDECDRKEGEDWWIPINGIYPVLVQSFECGEKSVWNLHQDIIIALKLLRKGDAWIRPDEDDVEVVRLTRDAEGKPQKMEIKNEFLKDYLCARQMGLYVLTYRARKMFFQDKPNIGWNKGCTEVQLDNGKWWGTYNETTENGFPLGEKATVIEASRTDIDPEDDVPIMDFPKDDCIQTTTKEVSISGKNVVHMLWGELWRNELILPGSESVRVRGDEPSKVPSFIIDASGKSVPSSDLKDGMRWLWFDAEVANALLAKNRGFLVWYTLETGAIGCGQENSVHFGINDSGHITVYAKDISFLPIWIQQIWAGYNISPDGGGVARELMMSQVEAKPASTQAPEHFLPIEYKRLNASFQNKYGIPLFNITTEVEDLLVNVNRFISVSSDGFFELAKNLAKLTCDSINKKALLKLLTGVEEKLGSLKVLEGILIQKESIADEEAKSIMAPFFGINELRQTDAHIKGPDAEKAMQTVGINKDLIPLFRGTAMLCQFVNTIATINGIITNEKETGETSPIS